MSGRPSAATSIDQHEAASSGYFAPLATARYLLLTTFRPDGIPVSTAVHGVADGDRAYFQAWDRSAAVTCLRHTEEVEVKPCTVLGLVSSEPPLDAVARRLPGDQASRVARTLARKYPVQQRFLIPLLRRARRSQMVHFELLTYEAAADQPA